MLTGLFYFHKVASLIRLTVLSLCRFARREGEEKLSKKGRKVSIKAAGIKKDSRVAVDATYPERLYYNNRI